MPDNVQHIYGSIEAVRKGDKGDTGAQGPQGPAGADGVSPSVEINEITGGHSVTITDADHPGGQTFNVMDGTSGASTIAEPVKLALLQLASKVAYIDDDGQDYYQDLYDALYPLTSITAVYTQSGTVYTTDSLDSLKSDLVVTAVYDGGSTETVSSSDYTLSGNLTEGTSVITVSYGGKTTTFNVTVTAVPDVYTVVNTLTGCTNSNSAATVTEGASYSGTITASLGYTLSGATVSITMGDTDITASAYNNGTISIASVTGNIVITVAAVVVTLSSISAVYTQSGTVYDTDSLDSLKTDLVVTAHWDDNTSTTVASADYTLSGTLTTGTSTITVTYGGKTDTFTVTVTQGSVVLGYIGDNLIMLLDGIANGAGGTHETTVTTLADQSGNGYDWDAKAGTVTADNTALIFNGSASFEGNSTWKTGALTTPKTVEIVADVSMPTAAQCIIAGLTLAEGATGQTSVGSVSVKSGELLHYTGSSYGCIPITSGVHTYSFVNDGGNWTAYKDGTAVTNDSTTVSWNSGYKSFGAFIGSGGGSLQYFFTGKVYSYRIYSEALSASRIASNRANDVTRFSLGA